MKTLPFVLLLAAGCATPDPSPPPPVSAPAEDKPAVEAESPEWRRIAEELTKGLTVADQQKLLEAERHYQLALACFNRAEFDKAKEQAQAAVGKCPDHLAARKLLSDLNEILIGGPVRIPGIGEHDLRVAQVTIEQ